MACLRERERTDPCLHHKYAIVFSKREYFYLCEKTRSYMIQISNTQAGDLIPIKNRLDATTNDRSFRENMPEKQLNSG